jgi:hypothetical protein
MQRPDAKILEGALKNNLTVRMGFKCADLINARIIGTLGSEKLKENGRMLLKLQGQDSLKEVQAPYLGLDEAKNILECPHSRLLRKNSTIHLLCVLKIMWRLLMLYSRCWTNEKTRFEHFSRPNALSLHDEG